RGLRRARRRVRSEARRPLRAESAAAQEGGERRNLLELAVVPASSAYGPSKPGQLQKAGDRVAGPLDGVRVRELPAIGPVPFLGMLLADLGAEIIRIDRRAGSAGLADAMATSPMGRGRRSIG